MIPPIHAMRSPSSSRGNGRLDQHSFLASDKLLMIRHDWSSAEALAIYNSPFMDLVFRAQMVHRASFDPNKLQFSKLLPLHRPSSSC
jgi:biotin synthase